MSSVIEKSIKPFLFVAMLLTGSCSSVSKNTPPDIAAYVANWHPKEEDGVSLDFIGELWQDMKSMDGVSMVPANDSFTSGNFNIAAKNTGHHVLVDLHGNEYSLPDDIFKGISKWLDPQQPTIQAWILVSTSMEKNERRVLAVALDGGPFHKTGEHR